MHGFTVFRQWSQYTAPFAINDYGFPVNRHVTVAPRAFLATLALWLLRCRDYWSLDLLFGGAQKNS